MSRRIAFMVLALTGAALVLSEPAFARGGMGGMRGGGGFRGPLIMHSPRAVLPASPRAIARESFKPHLGNGLGYGLGHGQRSPGSAARQAIPPSPHGYATTTPQHPFGRLVRRSHGKFHRGWVFPTTYDGYSDYGYIGIPYDPSEAIPVYGPAPSFAAPSYDEPTDPPAARRAPAAARVTSPDDEGRDACRAENVTVPAGQGERTIKVVRC